MNTYVWLFRREFWENRSIWLVPASVCALLLVVALFGKIEMSDVPVGITSEQGRMIGAVMLFGLGAVLFAVMSIYTAWYLLDCLHADRKDKSILFWKSLPISDTDTVLSKLAMASIVIPLVYFLAADVATLGAAFILSVRAASPIVSNLWQIDIWLQLQVLWLYIIFTQALWFLPLAGWLMLVSAWARRAPALWAILPPLTVAFLEYKIAGTRWFASMLLDRVAGYVPRAFHDGSNGGFTFHAHVEKSDINAPTSVWELIDPQGFFSSPALWAGILAGAALIVAAIVLRHRRSEA